MHVCFFVAQREKIAFTMRIALSCNASWVRCPAHLELMNMQRQFTVKVDPTSLTPGVHFTEVVTVFLYFAVS